MKKRYSLPRIVLVLSPPGGGRTSQRRGFTTLSTTACSSSFASSPLAAAAAAAAGERAPPTNDLAPMAPAPYRAEDLHRLSEFIFSRKRLVALCGAGCSTESGLPDYRSPNGSYSKGHKPTKYQEFVASEQLRKRYWARNMQGWLAFSQVAPNATHHALAQMERENLLTHIITQNVDRLHQKAGTKNITELHGHNHAVVCLTCRQEEDRQHFQQRLEGMNPHWVHLMQSAGGSGARGLKDVGTLPERESEQEKGISTAKATLMVQGIKRPDGDADISIFGNDYSSFVVPNCMNCEKDGKKGILKPAVVFFGENVPRDIVEHAMTLTKESDGLLVVGSSLMVYSAFRFVRAAQQHGIPVAILNIGPTRADDQVSLKVEARCGELLPLVMHKYHLQGSPFL
ncbi:NAD-dependent protein deacetylase srt2 [Balamuthia mandrillaris]